MTKTKGMRRGAASPSQRLKAAAAKPAPLEPVEATGAEIVTPVVAVAMVGETKASLVRVRSKWIVVDKREVAVIVDGAPRTRWVVRMKPVYEPLSILHGQATVQGCADNRMFGAGVPEAELVMTLDSKAIADAYESGRAYLQDHVEVQPELRPLW